MQTWTLVLMPILSFVVQIGVFFAAAAALVLGVLRVR